MKYRADIEGLRAVAVVPVVAFHVWPAAMPGGFVGVDIFFVISGFLITTLLMQRLQSGSYSILAFYGARIRRIFPALFVMLAVSSCVAIVLLPPEPLKEFARTLGATAVFMSNMELYRISDYFAGASDLKPLLHTWSLAVEEQFYIAFPPLLALVFRRARRYLMPVLMASAIISLAASLWLVQRNPPAAFYFAPPRAFELLIGAMLAVAGLARAVDKPASRSLWHEAAALAGLLLIGVALFGFSSSTPFPGWAALLPAGGAGLLIWAGMQDTWGSRLLSVAPARAIGLLSYSLYLWHWPVIVFTRHYTLGEPGTWARVLAVVASVGLASLSVRFVERPLRHLHSEDRRLLAFGAGCVVAAGLACVVMLGTSGLKNRFDARSQRLFAAAHDSSPKRQQCHGAPDQVIPYERRCIFGHDARTAQTAVWGDSHGAELAWAMGQLPGFSGGGIAQITSSSCPPALNYQPPRRPLCAAHNDETIARLTADPAVRTVVLVARYALYSPDDQALIEHGLAQAIERLSHAGKHVVLLGPVPDPQYPVPAATGMLASWGKDPSAFGSSFAEHQAKQRPQLEMLRRLATARPNVLLYEPSDKLCAAGHCLTLLDGIPLYFDDNHLSTHGASLVGTDLLTRLVR